MLASTAAQAAEEARRHGRAHPGQLDPGRRRRGGLPRGSGRPGPGQRPGQGRSSVPGVPRATRPSPGGQRRSRTAATSMAETGAVAGVARPRGADPARRSAPPTRTTRSASAGGPGRGRRGRAGVRRRDARPRALDLHVRRARASPSRTAPSPARTLVHARRARRSCASPTASTGTATRVTVCVGIAASGDGHVGILSRSSPRSCSTPTRRSALREATEAGRECCALLQPADGRGAPR